MENRAELIPSVHVLSLYSGLIVHSWLQSSDQIPHPLPGDSWIRGGHAGGIRAGLVRSRKHHAVPLVAVAHQGGQVVVYSVLEVNLWLKCTALGASKD